MGRVVHFEITADDIARARKFYEIFGWQMTDSSMPNMEYWLVQTGNSGPGIDGAITPRYSGSQPVRNTIDVSDLDGMIAKVKEAGGVIDGEKMTIPGIGDYINVKDTEGNQFGMLQAAPIDN